MPAGLAKLANNTRLNWGYNTAPEPQLDNRVLWWPRGRVLGGSSSINAMCYVRGVPADYDDWAASGAPGWDWQSVLPYFRRAEGNERGGDALHGGDGPLSVSDLRYVNVLSRAFVEAGQQAGYPRNDDFNGPRQEGLGLYQVTQRDGARCSAAVAYLAPARQRPNLTVHTGALVSRITFDGTSTPRSRRGSPATTTSTALRNSAPACTRSPSATARVVPRPWPTSTRPWRGPTSPCRPARWSAASPSTGRHPPIPAPTA
jgi:choline dehydrogenase